MTNHAVLPPIYAPLDDAIAPLVLALRRDGFATTHSSDGSDTWQAVPWISVATTDAVDRATTTAALLAWCRNHGVVANICSVRSTIFEVPAFIRVEVLSKLSEAQL